MDIVRIGVIGIGNIGTAHTCALYNGKVKNAVLAAICDIDEKRLEYCRANFPGINYYSDWDEIINDDGIDAVIVSVPHPLHSLIAETALKKGKNTLVEKPVDITVTAAKRLNATAEASDKVFAIMFNQRTNELFAKARDIVKGGELGQLKRTVWIVTNWYRSQHYYNSGTWRATWSGEGGGVLLNQAPHNLDIWQWICGMPQTVTAFCDTGKYHNIEVEDEATIITKYDNGAVGTFITSTGEYPGTNRLEISGSKGKIVIENGVLKHWKLSEDEREFCFSSEQSFPKMDTEYEEITPSENETAHVGIIQNFTNAILFGEPLISPGTDGINELTISNAAFLSSWKNNSAINIPFDSNEFDKMLAELQKNSKQNTLQKTAHDGGEYNPRWQVKW